MKRRSGARVITVQCPYARYVAMKSTRDTAVVAHGNDLGKVLAGAEKAGASEPFVVFPHDPSKKYVYGAFRVIH